MSWADEIKRAYTPAKSDPWIQRKFFVGVLVALVVWSCYVVIGRACAPLIRSRLAVDLSRWDGIGVLVGYAITFLIFGWSYLKMILTDPGQAVRIVPKSAPPVVGQPPLNAPQPEWQASPLGLHSKAPREDGVAPDPSTLAPIGGLIHQGLQTAIGSPSSNLPNDTSTASPRSTQRRWENVQRPTPRVHYGPRWCQFCEINKPDRTHHCRHCGTCVLQFDHHCIWIGQCVGWANHKFFIIFTFWAAVYCSYIIIFLAIFSQRSTSVDGQVIGLIAVSALFGLFTLLMFTSHVYLIVTGRSTVESYRSRDQEEQEARVLQTEYGLFRHNGDKRKIRRRWKEEYGGVPIDARWRWGSNLNMWKQEMGDSWLSWILPYGRPQGDGIHFKSNPHFGPNGEWLKKKDWPKNVGAQD